MQNEQSGQAAPTPEVPQPPPQSPAPAQNNGLAIVGLAVAIFGVLLCWVTFAGLAIAVTGLVLSIVGLKKAKQMGGAGKSAATAGIALAIFGVVLGGAFTACQIACTAAASRYSGELEKIGKEWQQEAEAIEKAIREAQDQAERDRQ